MSVLFEVFLAVDTSASLQGLWSDKHCKGGELVIVAVETSHGSTAVLTGLMEAF